MHPSLLTTSLALMLSMFAQSTTATIALGSDDAGASIAWIDGDTECRNVVVANSGRNPCGHRFTLNNGQTYSLAGCGGPGLTVLNGDGSFNSNCRFKSVKLNCGIVRNYPCY